jgi:hypothetical protein
MKDSKGNELKIGDTITFWAGWPPMLPLYLVGSKATVLGFGRKFLKVRAHDDVYGTRSVPSSCVTKK